MKVSFDELEGSDLIIDCVYEGGTNKNLSSEPLPKLFPKCGNRGGFRKVNRNKSNKPAYVILSTTMSELEWPDYLDEETGIFRYYGDNRKPGRNMKDTKAKGNELLEKVFNKLYSNESLEDIPPFFIFKKTGNGYDVQFLGLAAPSNPNLSSNDDLVSFWRTIDEKRFQNYVAYFTVLDTGEEPITQEWLNSLIYNHEENLNYAPTAWKNFIKKGKNGIKALEAPKIHKVPHKNNQIPYNDEEGMKCINLIKNHYKDKEQGFEACAVALISMIDRNFIDFKLTQPWRDGGRDAIGKYKITTPGKNNLGLTIDCALEAKCYDIKNSVGVKDMSRLISRIKHRQFGVLVTTSYVNNQAYKEVIEDGHPILIVTASDIAAILKLNSITSENIESWLNNIDANDERLF